MTSAGGFSSTYRNLDAIGIGVSKASVGNISTENSQIVALSFDKERFTNAFKSNPNEVYSLLVNNTTNKGVLLQVEDILSTFDTYYTSQSKAYRNQIQTLTEKVKKETQSLQRYKEQLEAKFSSMDMLIAQMQQQYSSFLKS